MGEFMARSTPEERQAGLAAWNKWRAEAEETLHFEFGAVVQSVAHIQQSGSPNAYNEASNYAFAEANAKDDVIKTLQSHPHLQRKGASIDVLEVSPMPGQ